ncbi:NAD(P)/FAD-dependent oxidoreductase, partial [Klebsiella pneumoniae]|uniref:NAD(P)/FAD-dependent oxidoreductase n=1 Tax=Klebsiella pneumoniae TaxID=573 RepID=UPI003EDF19C3
NELSSRTMEARKAPGLYFIGEVMDVTGWLGGYNFQWAWSSAWMMGIGMEITLIVSLTLVCITLWSAIVSSVIPMVLKRIGI